MTRLELIDYVCRICDLNEEVDRTACAAFISKRYELIFNQFLWKDTLVCVDITVDPADENNAEGIILLPEVIDRVVAVRTACQSVAIRGLEDFYRVDFDKFSQQGSAYEFAILSPLWFVWRGLAGLQVTNDAADDAKILKVTWRDTNGKRYVQRITLASGSPPSVGPGVATVTVSGAAIADVNGTWSFSQTLNDKPYFLNDVTDRPMFYGVIGSGDSRWGIYSATNGGLVYYAYEDVASPDLVVTWIPNVSLGGAAPLPVVTLSGDFSTQKIEIESVFKPETTGSVVFEPQLLEQDDGGTLLLSDTRSPSYQRIRLFSIPTEELTLSVLGKKKFVPLDFDEEEPEIRNIDPCLIAFSSYDLLCYARRYGDAQPYLVEGTALLGELARLETMQAANHVQFRPTGGYGNQFSARRRGGIRSF